MTRAALQPCGTFAAYKRHRKSGEEACAACKKAAADQSAERYTRLGKPYTPVVRTVATKACAVCYQDFDTVHMAQVYCSSLCRYRRRHPTSRKTSVVEYKKRTHSRTFRRTRRRVLREEPNCWLCLLPIDPDEKWPALMSGTVDHVIAIGMGGSVEDRANMRAAHFICNSRRQMG